MEESLLKSDIFFIITTICVIIISGVFIIVLVYFLKFLKDAREVIQFVKEEGKEVAADLRALRSGIKEKTESLGAIFSALSFFRARKRKKTKKESNKEDEIIS